MAFKRFSQLSKTRQQRIIKRMRREDDRKSFRPLSRGEVRKAFNKDQRKKYKNRSKLTTDSEQVDNTSPASPAPAATDSGELLAKLIDASKAPQQEGIDYDRIAASVPQVDYEALQPDAPSFAKNVATSISGSSAGGIRRRRSKRSQLGINAMGTGQLKRRSKNKLTLGGLNI